MRTTRFVAILVACAGAVACSVTVPSPDLSFLTDTVAGDPGPDAAGDAAGETAGDTGGDVAGDVAGGEDVVTKDEPTPDEGPTDEGPIDTGHDAVVVPQNGGHACTSNDQCVSGGCTLQGWCTCRDGNDCDKGLWCDAGDTSFYGTANCLAPRQNFAGCTQHVQCKSGACSLSQDGSGESYCAECATGGTSCEGTDVCCGGSCVQGCLGCAVAPPPAPVYTFCASGCYDASVDYCSPNGPAPKLGAGQDCQFVNSWCLTGSCLVDVSGAFGLCACDDSIAPCTQGACFEGKCEMVI